MMYQMMKNKYSKLLVAILLASTIIGCSTPEEKAQKYYEKGMELLNEDTEKAKLEFQNALQIKKNMVPAIYGLALASEKKAEWKAVFTLLTKVIELQPHHVDANIKIAQLFLAAGNIEEAEKYLEKIKEIAPTEPSVIVLAAGIDLKNKKYDEAVEKANTVLEIDDKNRDALMILATERYQLNDTEQALGYIDKAIAVDSENVAFHTLRLKMVKSLGDFKRTENTYKHLIKMFPNKTYFRSDFAQFYFDSRMLSESEEQLRAVVDSTPDNNQPKLDLVKFIANTKGQLEAQRELQKMIESNPENYDLAFYLVDYYDSKNDTDASIKLLNKIVKDAGEAPASLTAKVRIAGKKLQSGDKENAVALIEEILNKDDGHYKALLLKAGIQITDRKYDDAILTLRRALRDQPSSAEALFLMAKVQELSGSTALSDESYVQAMSASKDAPKIGIPFAKSLVARKETKRAQKILEDVLNRYPNNIDTIKYLAQLKIIDGDIKGAQALLQNVPSGNQNLFNLIQGAIHLKEKNIAGGLESFKKAHAAAPGDIQTILAVVNTYLTKNDVDAAQKFLNEVLEKDANNYGVKLILAQLSARSGDTNKSTETYESAIKINPKNIQAYQGLATLYAKERQLDKAKEVLNRGLNNLPYSFDLKMLLAELHTLSKDYPEAISVYRDLSKNNPGSMIALNNYISVVADYESDSDKLVEAYNQAQKLKLLNAPQFLDTLGWISYRTGKLDEAINYISQAATKAPKYAVFQYHLGKVYLANGDKDNAKVYLKKALVLSKGIKFEYKEEINKLLKDV